MTSFPDGMETVELNGDRFGIDVAFDDVSYAKSPQNQFIGADSEAFWAVWSMNSFHGGERLKHILSQEEFNAFRYHDGEGVDVNMLAEWGELKLQPVLSRSLAVQSATMPMCTSADGSTLFVGLTASPYIKKWTSAGGWVNITSVPNTSAVTDLINYGTKYFGVQGGVPMESTDGANFTALTGSHTGVNGIAYVNGELYLSKSDGIYNHTAGSYVTQAETADYIVAYRENLYFAKDKRLFLYNGRTVTNYDELPQGFNVTGLFSYRGLLFIPGYFKARSGYRAAVFYIVQGSDNHLYSVGDSTGDSRLYALAGSDDEIFFANPVRGGADRYSMNGGISCGPATGTAMYTPPKSMAVCDGYLFVGRYDNVAGTDGVYVADLIAPTTYRTQGWLTTPSFDFGYPNNVKLFRDVTIEHDALTTGQSVIVYYQIDGDGTWTKAATSNVVNATRVVGELSNVRGNNVKLKLELNAGGSDTTTPTVRKTVVRAAPIAESKWRWKVRLTVLPRFGGASLFTNFERAYAAGHGLSFIDVDGTKHEVVVAEANLIRKASQKNDLGFIIADLREI